MILHIQILKCLVPPLLPIRVFDAMMDNYRAEYSYAYQLKGEYNHAQLQDWLSEMKFDETKVSDKYMKKTIDDVNDEISEFTERCR